MPKKLIRGNAGTLVPTSARSSGMAISTTGAGLIATGYVVGQTAKGVSSIVTATVELVGTTIESVATCVNAYFNYLEECQRTRQVEIWSHTVIMETREHTKQLEIQKEQLVFIAIQETRRIESNAEITSQQIKEVQEIRRQKAQIINVLLNQHNQLHTAFLDQASSGSQNLSLDERVRLEGLRSDIINRLQDLERTVASLAQTL